MKSIFNGKDYITTVDDDTADAIMTDIIGKRKSHIEIDGELYKTTYLQVKNGDWKPVSSSLERKIKYDAYDPEDKQKILSFEKMWTAWYEKNEKPFERFLEEQGAIRITGENVTHDYSIKRPALFEDLRALWNGYNYLGLMRERAARLSNQNIKDINFLDQETKGEINVEEMFNEQ